jgi:hypothetical protein
MNMDPSSSARAVTLALRLRGGIISQMESLCQSEPSRVSLSILSVTSLGKGVDYFLSFFRYFLSSNLYNTEIVRDFVAQDAVKMLSNLRVPAALFASAALSSLYASELGKKQVHHWHERTQNSGGVNTPFLRSAYIMLSVIAFLSHVATVYCSTMTSQRMIAGAGSFGFHASAANLVRECFELEYLSTILLFNIGTGAFLFATALRGFIAFPTRRDAWLVSIFTSLSIFLIRSFSNAAVDDFGGLQYQFSTLLSHGVEKLPQVIFTRQFLWYASAIALLHFCLHHHSRVHDMRQILSAQGVSSSAVSHPQHIEDISASLAAAAAEVDGIGSTESHSLAPPLHETLSEEPLE